MAYGQRLKAGVCLMCMNKSHEMTMLESNVYGIQELNQAALLSNVCFAWHRMGVSSADSCVGARAIGTTAMGVARARRQTGMSVQIQSEWLLHATRRSSQPAEQPRKARPAPPSLAQPQNQIPDTACAPPAATGKRLLGRARWRDGTRCRMPRPLPRSQPLPQFASACYPENNFAQSVPKSVIISEKQHPGAAPAHPF